MGVARWKSTGIKLSHGNAYFAWQSLSLKADMPFGRIENDHGIRSVCQKAANEQGKKIQQARHHPAILPDEAD